MAGLQAQSGSAFWRLDCQGLVASVTAFTFFVNLPRLSHLMLLSWTSEIMSMYIYIYIYTYIYIYICIYIYIYICIHICCLEGLRFRHGFRHLGFCCQDRASSALAPALGTSQSQCRSPRKWSRGRAREGSARGGSIELRLTREIILRCPELRIYPIV